MMGPGAVIPAFVAGVAGPLRNLPDVTASRWQIHHSNFVPGLICEGIENGLTGAPYEPDASPTAPPERCAWSGRSSARDRGSRVRAPQRLYW